MSSNIRKFLGFSSFVIVAAIGVLWLSGINLLSDARYVFSQNSAKSEVKKTPGNPCGFMVDVTNPIMGDMVLEKQNRDENGYSTEITLADAVKLFNDELQCYPHRATLPPLTEEEVIAAVVAGSEYGTKDLWKLQSKALWEIALHKKMPKGTLLVHTDGARVIDYPLGREHGFVVKAKGQRIYMFLGLDKIPSKGGFVMKPEQFFLIRKTIFGWTSEN